MNWLQSRLHLFTQSQRIDIINHVTREKFESLPEQEQNDIKYLFTKISTDTSKESLDLVYDCLIRAALFDGIIKVFKVNQGENFKLVIEPEEGDNYTGYNIVARENKTGKILSEVLTGSDQAQQHLDFINLDLEAPNLYKVRIQLEDQSNPGDGISLLAVVYFAVLLNIDVTND